MQIGLDLDGTLITCRQRQVSLMRAIVRAHGFSLCPTTFWRAKSGGKNNKGALIECGFSGDLVEYFCKLWVESIETSAWLTLDSLMPDAYTLLNNDNFSLHLITARSNPRLLKLQLSSLGIDRYFSSVWVVSPIDSYRKKAAILRELKCEIHIGDSEVDLNAAKLAGCYFMGVEHGQRSRGFLTARGAPLVASGLIELCRQIQGW